MYWRDEARHCEEQRDEIIRPAWIAPSACAGLAMTV
jgi:hypothetical protein